MSYKRRKTRVVKVSNIRIGGGNPVSIQGMTKTETKNVSATVKQINQLENIGAEIVRIAVKDIGDARAIKEIKKKTGMPLVADIHFNYQFAIEAIKNGVDKIRLNPGNIYELNQIKEVVACAKEYKIPIRVGVNSGSLRKSSSSLVNSMVKSALDYIKTLERLKFFDIVVSLKASEVQDTISAYEKLAKLCDYPLHLGVTATGPLIPGTIKSTLAIGSLLKEGVGDTIRVSLTSRPEDEIMVSKEILQSLGLRNFSPEIISCPTCGRCQVDLIKIVNLIKNKVDGSPSRNGKSSAKKIAIMGCIVNGPGEAKQADMGIAFTRNLALVFKKGKVIKKTSQKDSIDFILKQLEKG
ncbi:MAG: flavodoxin-dependent (E)-4-hydroxy-3-methylbut-2-enyl-diphosphate synthase [Candidatus Omnitrophica bacterium]|nr:flavodoxin-dependent (E)-4-hydroxy-3-methylbut-2-enyl-diphosphate synthase [Candidatus Omnitrophota bacterium]